MPDCMRAGEVGCCYQQHITVTVTVTVHRRSSEHVSDVGLGLAMGGRLREGRMLVGWGLVVARRRAGGDWLREGEGCGWNGRGFRWLSRMWMGMGRLAKGVRRVHVDENRQTSTGRMSQHTSNPRFRCVGCSGRLGIVL